MVGILLSNNTINSTSTEVINSISGSNIYIAEKNKSNKFIERPISYALRFSMTERNNNITSRGISVEMILLIVLLIIILKEEHFFILIRSFIPYRFCIILKNITKGIKIQITIPILSIMKYLKNPTYPNWFISSSKALTISL